MRTANNSANLGLAILLLFSTVASAQQPDCRRRTIAVGVTDERGMPISGLTAANFRGEFGGAPVRVLSARLPATPNRVVMLLDKSGSMTIGGMNLEGVMLAWRFARKVADSGGQLALITFADETSVLADFGADKQSLINLSNELTRIDEKAFKGRTRLWDAIETAIKLLDPPQPGDAIFLASDGWDNESSKQRSNVQKLLQASGIRFFAAVLWPADLQRSARSGQGLAIVGELRELGTNTGGGVFDFQLLLGGGYRYDLNSEMGKKVIFNAADMILAEIQKPYFVEVEIVSEVDKPQSWNEVIS